MKNAQIAVKLADLYAPQVTAAAAEGEFRVWQLLYEVAKAAARMNGGGEGPPRLEERRCQVCNKAFVIDATDGRKLKSLHCSGRCKTRASRQRRGLESVK